MTATQTITIVVPGTTGSTLVLPVGNSGAVELIWSNAATTNPSNLSNLLSQDGLVVGQISTGYYPLMNAIAAVKGAVEILVTPQVVAAGAQSASQTCLPVTSSDVVIGFGYDWRVDVKNSAASLASLMTQVYTSYGKNCALYVVAHSMGGLVTRYAFESGLANTPQIQLIFKSLTTLGTPHEGAPMALAAIINDLPGWLLSLLGLPGAQVEEFVNLTAFDSTFELLPPSSYNYISHIKLLERTWYSTYSDPLLSTLTGTYNVNATNMTAAAAFWETLASPSSFWKSTNLNIAYGSALVTITGFTYDPDANTVSGPLALLAGDTIVPSDSASFASFANSIEPPLPVQAFPDVSHLDLPSNSDVITYVTGIVYPS